MGMILEHPILAKKSPPVRKKISELEKSALFSRPFARGF